jgi:hypothetical protein
MTTATHIRAVFLDPKPVYSIAEAAELLGMEWEDVKGWLLAGERESITTGAGLRIEWAELVSFGMDFWSQEIVEQLLGADLAQAIPELLRLADLHVRIPQLEILALQHLASTPDPASTATDRSRPQTVSAVLSHHVRDLLSAHSEELAEAIPNFATAFAWPYGVARSY